jgi:rhodanese-related sulfurtransferase
VDTATAPPSLQPAQLAALVGRADAPLLLDVRRTPKFEASERLIAGARHCPPEDVAALAAHEPPRSVIVYCAYGHEVSRDAAAMLLAQGWDARWLAGGIEGGEPDVDAAGDVERWRQAAPPQIRKRPELGVTGQRPSRWITRARPKIDRIACPWLIRRFIDPRAEFFYVPESQVFDEAQRLGAVPFDIDGAPVSHEWERCSFDALLRLFELRMPALEALAEIVRGADTSRLALAPQAAGLLAVSLGLSRLHADDHAMLAAALPLYDALFEWCRAGRDETHSWRVHPPAVAA